MRIALAAAFFVEADILLLDEPTNHLDFPSVLWLENRLRSYRQSFIIIAHDRDMLENVCTSLIWLTEKTLKYFPIGFRVCAFALLCCACIGGKGNLLLVHCVDLLS